MLPRVPLGRIVNDLCFLPNRVLSIGCIHIETPPFRWPNQIENKLTYLPKVNTGGGGGGNVTF